MSDGRGDGVRAPHGGTPQASTDEERVVAGVVRTFVYGTLPLTLVFAVTYSFMRSDLLLRTWLQASVFCSLGLTALVLVGRGRVRLAVRLLSTVFWVVVAFSAYTGGGVHAPAFPSFAAIILMTGVLWSSGAALAMTGLTVAFGGLLVALDTAGALPPSRIAEPTMGRFVASCLVFGTVATLQYLAAKMARQGVARASAENERRRLAEARREETLRALERSEERYRSIFESAAVALFEVDLSGVRDFLREEAKREPRAPVRDRLPGEAGLAAAIASRVRMLDVNAAGLRVVDLERKSALLGPLTTRFQADNPAGIAEVCIALTESTETVQRELSIVSYAGRPKRVLVSGRRPDVDGHGDRLVVSVLDVTEQRRLESRSRVAQRLEAIGRLAGGVAHDFNNALVVIISWTSLLRRPGRTEQERADGLLAIEKSAERAAQLTRQLMSIGRRGVHEPKPIDVGVIIDETVRAISRLLPADIEVRVSHRCELPAMADEAELQQVLLNMALNARDAMPQGGVLEFGTRLAAASEVADLTGRTEYVVISVRDTGVGMDEQTQQNLFEPFFTTKSEGRGTGLGLATAQAIVVELHGKITVDSKPGQGTTFTMYLPAAATPSQSIAKPVEVAQRSAGGTVLLVEDEPMVRDVLEQTLRGAGYAVLSAGDGEQALSLARRRLASDEPRIDLLCTDGILPGMATRDVITAFSLMFPDAPVLVCSGHVQEELVRRGIERGEWSFLGKPFPPDLLLRKVAELLQRAPGE